MKTKTHLKQASFFTIALILSSLFTTQAAAEAEKCDPFTFAARGAALPPMTLLKAGAAPILSIAGHLFHYDPTRHCLSEGSGDCAKTQKVISGGKVVALVEGSPMIKIFSPDARGGADHSAVFYQMMVEHDVYRTTQPRFWLEAINPHDAAGEEKVIGRLDAVDGLTIDQMKSVKARIATAHKLVDLSRSSAMYSNCRKLAVVPFDLRYYPTQTRVPASNSPMHSLAQPPRPLAVIVARHK